jgi:hypothetical protein
LYASFNTSPTSLAVCTRTTASGKKESLKLSMDAEKRLSSSTKTRPGNFRRKDLSAICLESFGLLFGFMLND